MEKLIKITLSDTGACGEILIGGKWLGVAGVEIAVAGHGRTMVTLQIPARYCDITYDAEFRIGADDNNDRRDLGD